MTQISPNIPSLFGKATLVAWSALALAGCQLVDFVSPNPDAKTLYSDPYITLKQLSSTESRLMNAAERAAIRGRLDAQRDQVAQYQEALVPASATIDLQPPGEVELGETRVATAGFSEAELTALAQRQASIDLELGEHSNAVENARMIAERMAQQEAARQEQLDRIAQLNELMAQPQLPVREIESVPPPENNPQALGELFTGSEDGEVPFSNIFFESGSAELSPRATAVLRANAFQIRSESRVSDLTIFVRGHAGGGQWARTQSDRDGNMAISKTRAEAVRDALIAGGVDPAIIEIEWFGDTKPAFIENNEHAIFYNQRVDVTARLNGRRENAQ